MRIGNPEARAGASSVSTVRLYVMRAAYLFMAIGLVVMIWPLLLRESAGVEHMRGVTWSLLTGVSLLAFVGVRYPLQMVPLLLFELAWKSVWLLAIGLPMRRAGTMGPGEAATWFDCLVGVVFCLIAIPWGYVLSNYVIRPGDRWRRERPRDVAALP